MTTACILVWQREDNGESLWRPFSTPNVRPSHAARTSMYGPPGAPDSFPARCRAGVARRESPRASSNPAEGALGESPGERVGTVGGAR
jgi:hypothetical protein